MLNYVIVAAAVAMLMLDRQSAAEQMFPVWYLDFGQPMFIAFTVFALIATRRWRPMDRLASALALAVLWVAPLAWTMLLGDGQRPVYSELFAWLTLLIPAALGAAALAAPRKSV